MRIQTEYVMSLFNFDIFLKKDILPIFTMSIVEVLALTVTLGMYRFLFFYSD